MIKKPLSLLAIIAIFCLSTTAKAQEIEWKTWDEAQTIIQNNPDKRIFLDVYTTWCRWCKELDKVTFSDTEVINYINKQFVPIKWDAQDKETVRFFGKAFSKQGTYNDLALSILDNHLEFPAMVFINSKGMVEDVFFGYYSAEELLPILQIYNSSKK